MIEHGRVFRIDRIDRAGEAELTERFDYDAAGTARAIGRAHDGEGAGFHQRIKLHARACVGRTRRAERR